MTDDPFLKFGTVWTDVEVVSEPSVQLLYNGYVPYLRVKTTKNGLTYKLAISAKSLAEPLEKLRLANGGSFIGLAMTIRKASLDRMAKYEVKTGETIC